MTEVRQSNLPEAYSYCREVARREAKNFYWAFRALPRAKSDAMCAVYAFMRKADDLADDESLSIPARREAMLCWTNAWHRSRTEPATDPVFIALLDTQRRFDISDHLLEQLVAGTTMDLQDTLPGVDLVHLTATTQVYRTFDDLYRYCYLVASVVGLTCIKIFGYTDPRAELLAERTGVAFQLTNILRDIREDAERGRIYLPLDEQATAGVTVEDFDHIARGEQASDSARVAMRSLVQREIERTRELYRSADELIPLLDKGSRPAMRVLVNIYRELLERIAQNPEAVFLTRVSVPTSRKLTILLRGMAASFAARIVR